MTSTQHRRKAQGQALSVRVEPTFDEKGCGPGRPLTRGREFLCAVLFFLFFHPDPLFSKIDLILFWLIRIVVQFVSAINFISPLDRGCPYKVPVHASKNTSQDSLLFRVQPYR